MFFVFLAREARRVPGVRSFTAGVEVRRGFGTVRGIKDKSMGFLLYVGTVLVGIPGILLFPAILPHFLTFLMNKRRIKGQIGAAK